MNKKLIAVAVAGMFAAPAAFAQSSVTISGLFKGGIENVKYSNFTRAGNNSTTAVVDDSSRIVFNVVEDLGGGLQAIGQYDLRIRPDDGASAIANVNSGNSHVGLRSKQWGRIFIGHQDLHYFNTESNMTDKGSLRSSSVSLLAFTGTAGGSTAVAGATRTQNVVHYTTPNWGGFTAIVAYSTNASAADADIGATTRKGSAWNVNPNFAAANWQIGYSYWSSKPDAQVAWDKQRGDRLYGSYVFPFGLKIGLAWDKSKFESTTGAGTTARRDAWSLPVSYAWGNHTVHANYSKAGDEKVAAGEQGAEMWAFAYSYDLSKRTSLALTYAQIKNKSGGTYNLFTSTSLGLGGSAGAMVAGEDPKMFGLTMRHAF
jgi:predicted porin